MQVAQIGEQWARIGKRSHKVRVVGVSPSWVTIKYRAGKAGEFTEVRVEPDKFYRQYEKLKDADPRTDPEGEANG
jgi:hypothetical protein